MGARDVTGPGGRLASIQDRMARSDRSARSHARMLRLSGGRVGARVQGKAVLLLTTTGRRSGRRRRTVLMYLEEGGRYLVVPSNAAEPDRPPAWWLNLQADAHAQVLVDGIRQDVWANALGEDERERLWPQLVRHNPNWGRYQLETTRRFPVVALTPIRS